MTNELLFIITGILSLGIVSVTALFGRVWLYTAMTVMYLITFVVVGKLGTAFGLVTAPGAATFAGLFLATDILSEFYGKNAAKRAIWIAFFAHTVFLVLGYLATMFEGGINPDIDIAVDNLFTFLPRVLVGSLVAFIVAQNYDVFIYHALKKLTNDKHLWFRNIFSTVTSQLLDSVLFITIAFGPGTEGYTDIIISIWILKSVIALFDTPFIYLVSFALKKYPSLRDWDKRLLETEK